MFRPVAPCCSAQPRITSSTSAGSMPARLTACSIACPARVAPCVMLKLPRHDLPSGVRAVDTITASVILMLSVRLIECLSLRRKLCQQRRRTPDALGGFVITCEAFNGALHAHQAQTVRIQHRAAAVGREAIAEDVDDVDVRSALGDAFLQDARALIDQRKDAALHDLGAADLAWRDAVLFTVRLDQRVHRRISERCTPTLFIAIPASAGLLANASLLAEPVGQQCGAGPFEFRVLGADALADGPADIVAREVTHAKWPHR